MRGVYFENGFERGFGTWPLKDDECRASIETALDVGVRAFDTAQMYRNEADVGAALKGAPRGELLITTKVHPDNFSAAAFLPSVETSLTALGVDQVDVLLLHWPPADGRIETPLELLAKAREAGLAAHVGVSNFTSAMMRACADIVDVPIAVNQVEFHPLLDQSVLLAASEETGIPLSSYCSVARGRVLDREPLVSIGAAHGKTPAQATLRWILQKGVSVNAMSTKPANIRANFEIDDFELSAGEMAGIDALGAEGHRIVTSDLVPWAPEWD